MTTNIQLNNIAKKLDIPNWRGVFMADELKEMKPLEKECGVCNFQGSTEQGSHWISWWKNKDDKFYFDSFGCAILPEVKEYLGSPILCQSFKLQKFNSNICGELCMIFLYLINKQIPYEDIILNMVEESN